MTDKDSGSATPPDLLAQVDVKQYREIPSGFDACIVCDEIVPHLRERRPFTRPSLRKHGKRGAWCPGSHQQGKPWVEAAHLPTWNEITDVDKGNCLMFVWKCHWERSYAYARDNYPATFTDHPVLRVLPRQERCRYANAMCWGDTPRGPRLSAHKVVQRRLGRAEFDRLYNLALDAERAS